jgi:hypothetical protein
MVEIRVGCDYARTTVDVVPGRTIRLNLPIEAGHGALRVDSEPPGALVFLDDAPIGPTPWASDRVLCGEHTLRLQAEGYYPAIRSVRVDLFAETVANVGLTAELAGALRIHPNPPELEVWVDGVRIPAPNDLVARLPIGPHHVEFRKEGFAAQSLDLVIEPGVTLERSVSLSPLARQRVEPSISSAASPRPVSRLALNGFTSAAGLTLGILAWQGYQDTLPVYEEFLAIPERDDAEHFYLENIRGRRVLFQAEGVASVLLLGGSAALWATTPRSVLVGPGGIHWFREF